MSLEIALRNTSEHFMMFSRNGRWGTCVNCPRDKKGMCYPEFCTNTDRGDHQLDAKSLAEKFEGYLKR